MTKILHVLFRVKYSSAVERTLPADVQNLELWSRKKSRIFHRQSAQLIKSRGKNKNTYLIKNSRGKETALKKSTKIAKKIIKKKKSLREMSFTNVKSN